MLRWLWRMIVGGCEHSWSAPEVRNILDDQDPTKIRGGVYEQRCLKCGKLKLTRFMA